MKTTVTEFEVVDHGIESAQYFQGCGIAYTKYNFIATGCGDNFAKAIDDALESMGQQHSGIDFPELEKRMLDADGINEWPVAPSVLIDAENPNDDADLELYYYVSIRYNVRD